MTIQPAAPDDLDTIRDLLRRVDLPHEDLGPAHLTHFLAARDGADMVGTVGVEHCGTAALLRSLAVAPECRNAGLGARLIDAIEQHAQNEGVHALYLLTTTAADYVGTHGYKRIDRDELPEAIQQTEEAARLCPASATCLQKRLAAAGP